MIEKFADFFDPTQVDGPVNIIGCGAIGSTLAVMLARCGINDFELWDHDTVASHNLANQQFIYSHVGRSKTEALKELILQINPQAKVKTFGKWIDDELAGYVFLAVDDIEVRMAIAKANKYNKRVKAMLDFRMRLKDAQHFATLWDTQTNKENFMRTMDFSQEEAKKATPVNSCGLEESIMPNVQAVVSFGVGNFINMVQTGQYERLIMTNPFDMVVV